MAARHFRLVDRPAPDKPEQWDQDGAMSGSSPWSYPGRDVRATHCAAYPCLCGERRRRGPGQRPGDPD